mgnify:CR=1 FL=1
MGQRRILARLQWASLNQGGDGVVFEFKPPSPLLLCIFFDLGNQGEACRLPLNGTVASTCKDSEGDPYPFRTFYGSTSEWPIAEFYRFALLHHCAPGSK